MSDNCTVPQKRLGLKVMISVRKTIAYLLVLALPLSAWAAAGTPCTQNSGTDTGGQIGMVDAHAHHDAGPPTSDGSVDVLEGHAAHHAAADKDSESTPAECPCCDGCDTVCVLTSCSPVALSTTSYPTALTGTDTHYLRADAFRDGPPPHVLFRPPIVSV